MNRYELAVARRNLKREQAALSRRLVAIYSSEEDTSALGVFLSATSLDDLVNRVDTVKAVNTQDARLIRQVHTYKALVTLQKHQLAQAHARQAQEVQDRANAKASIESQLSERKRLVASIKDEIVRLQAEERARQLELQREAAARLAAEQAAAAAAAAAPPIPVAPSASTGSTSTSSSSTGGDSAGVVVSTPDASVVPSSQYGGVVGIAMQYLGTPYVWGGASPGGFDCSGLVVYVYAQVGVSLPHYTGDLWNVGTPVSADQLQPGDLVFFYGLGHVGIYIGGGQFIHAPHTGDVVKISSLYDSWYASAYDGARRIL